MTHVEHQGLSAAQKAEPWQQLFFPRLHRIRFPLDSADTHSLLFRNRRMQPGRKACPVPSQLRPPENKIPKRSRRDVLVKLSNSHIHWPIVAKSDPAAHDAIHKPESHQRDR